MNIFQSCFDSPIGPLMVESTLKGLRSIQFKNTLRVTTNDNELTQMAVKQLIEYFNGKRRRFTIPTDINPTAFQKKVWHHVKWVPYASTRTYLDIALKLGDRNSVRAVGLANGTNPLPIIVPCHRIIGSNNKLVGYIGGLRRKAWLIEHERTFKPHFDELF